MLIADLLFAFVIALLLTGLFSYGFRKRDPWGNTFVFILLLFLLIWATGVWIPPFGPTIYDVAWIPMIVMGFIFILLFAAAIPESPEMIRRRQAKPTPAVGEPAIVVLGGFLWLLLIVLLGAVILGYLIV
jgi:hypothetical protein